MPKSDSGQFAILIPALISAVVLAASYRVPSLTHDSVTYLQIARNLLLDGSPCWQALWAPPFHGILIAAAATLTGDTDLLHVVSLLSPLACFLLVITVYLLATELSGRVTGVAAASLCALSPHLVHIAYSPEPEIIYTALLVLALLLFLRAVTRQSPGCAALAGAAFALAYLTRSEGLLVMLFVLVATALARQRSPSVGSIRRVGAMTVLLFVLVSLPYLVFLYRGYGAVVLSPKTSYVISWLKQADRHMQDAENPDIWGLERSGRLNWQVPKGAADLVAPFLAEPGRNITRYLRGLADEMPGRIPNGSGMEHFPRLVPVYLFVAALGSLFVPWGEQRPVKRAILFAPLLMLLVLPLFTGGWWKYLVPYYPLVVIAAVHGVAGWGELLGSRCVGWWTRHARVVAGAGLFLVVGGRYGYALTPATDPAAPMSLKQIEREQYVQVTRELGTEARRFFGPGRNYMAKWSKAIYYLDGRWTPFPLASNEEVVAYARSHKVDYILLEINDPEKMKTVTTPPPGVSLVKAFSSKEFVYMLAFFKVDH